MWVVTEYLEYKVNDGWGPRQNKNRRYQTFNWWKQIICDKTKAKKYNTYVVP